MIFNMSGGGGAGLNFKVCAYESYDKLPESANENTIAAITDEFSSWVLSPTEPETIEDKMLWISIGNSSPSGFNAIKKNCIMVYPINVKQYDADATSWMNIDSFIYQGEWTMMLTEVVFFADGEFNTEVFGNPTVPSGFNTHGIINGAISFGNYSGYSSSKLFDVSAFSIIEFVIGQWDYAHVIAYLVDSSGTKNLLTVLSNSESDGGIRTFDVSTYSGEYYLRLEQPGTNNNYVTYSSIKFKV